MNPSLRNFLKLYLTRGIGFKFLNGFYKTAETFEGDIEELLLKFGERKKLPKEKVKLLLERVREGEKALKEVEKLIDLYGVEVVPFYDNRFPKELNQLQKVSALFVLGNFDYQKGFAIVGTRRATAEGKEKAFQFAKELAKEDYLIVSGGAYGIDKKAHEGALSVGGRTALVLGEGLFRFLKREQKFAEKITSLGGFVVSQFPPFLEASKWTFPQRNALISSLSPYGVLVVEAPSQSGALITADYSLRLGRKVYTYLGCTSNPNYRGNIELISTCKGKLVLEPSELLKLLSSERKEGRKIPDKRIQNTETIDGKEKLLLLLEEKPRTFDELLILSNLSEEELTFRLTELELDGKITQEGGFFKAL